MHTHTQHTRAHTHELTRGLGSRAQPKGRALPEGPSTPARGQTLAPGPSLLAALGWAGLPSSTQRAPHGGGPSGQPRHLPRGVQPPWVPPRISELVPL